MQIESNGEYRIAKNKFGSLKLSNILMLAGDKLPVVRPVSCAINSDTDIGLHSVVTAVRVVQLCLVTSSPCYCWSYGKELLPRYTSYLLIFSFLLHTALIQNHHFNLRLVSFITPTILLMC